MTEIWDSMNYKEATPCQLLSQQGQFNIFNWNETEIKSLILIREVIKYKLND